MQPLSWLRRAAIPGPGRTGGWLGLSLGCYKDGSTEFECVLVREVRIWEQINKDSQSLWAELGRAGATPAPTAPSAGGSPLLQGEED